jgi:3-oxoacyl-[acyl-carrier protein] reductase
MTKIMQDKTVIITGTNRGMGKTMVECFAMNGANVWAHARELTQEFREF